MYLPFAFDMSFYGLTLFSMFYGLDWIATVPPTVRLLTRVGQRKDRDHGRLDHRMHQIGGAAAAYLGGVLRISFGTYLEAFILSGLMCIAAALMALLIGVGRKGRTASPPTPPRHRPPQPGQRPPPPRRQHMRDDDDLARADLDRVIGNQPERHNLAPADHPMAEIAKVPRSLRAGPAQDIGGVAHEEAHPFRPVHRRMMRPEWLTGCCRPGP